MKQIIVFLLSNLLVNAAFGQHTSSEQKDNPVPFILGIIDGLHSNELDETRILNIYLPEGYSQDSLATYPVIYLLDGSANEDFIHIAGIVQFLTMIDKMPKSIVVGIANIDRKRDFTFPTTIIRDKTDYPTTGHSAAFMAFIEKELQPYIQRKYRTNNVKTIIGQSLGGLFATEVLLKNPALFNNYIIVSPSLWWNYESLLTTPPAMPEFIATNIHVYISIGKEGKQMEEDAKYLVQILPYSEKENLRIHFLPLPDETHLTILHNSVYKGLEFLYKKTGNN